MAGVYGSGKTDRARAAAELAADVGEGLYRIDLAAVVSKYVGQTERSIGRVLASAEQAGGILLMDEAEARFGKRTEVARTRAEGRRVAHRAWLLMTRHHGLCLLSTAAPTSLDPVLRGRIRHEIVVRPHN